MKKLLFFILINVIILSYNYNLTSMPKKCTFGKNKPMQQSSIELELIAKEALINYVKKVILDKNNPEGENIRALVLDHRESYERKKAEREILSQAESFPKIFNENNQTYPWQLKKSKDPTNACLYYSGMIFGLATEIEFEENNSVAKVRVELD